MAGIMDAILGLQQRLGQHADAANASMQYAHNNPSPGSVAGSFKDTVLGTLLGLPMEAFGALAKAGAGEIAYPIAAAQAGLADQSAHGGIGLGADPNSTATAAARQIVAGGSPLNPGGAIDAARTSPDTGVSDLAGILELVTNPLNYAGPVGQFGRGLEAGAPLAGRTIAGLGDALSGFNEISGAPIGMLTKGGRARLAGILDQLTAPGAQAAPALTTDLPQLAALRTGQRDRLAEALGRDQAIAGTGLDPTTALGARALPNGYKNPAAPGLPDPLAVEIGAARNQIARGANPLANAAPDLNAWVNRASDPTERLLAPGGPLGALGTGPSQVAKPNALAALVAEQLRGGTAITDLTPRTLDTALPEAAPATPALSLADQLQALRTKLAPSPTDRASAYLAGRTPRQLMPPEAITPAEEAAAARFDYPADTPLAPTAMPDFPVLTGDRASILRGLPTQEIDTLLNVAYGHEDAITNALNKYTDPADLVEAALSRITSSSAKAGLLHQASPDLAQKLAFLPDAVPTADSAIADLANGNAAVPAVASNVDNPTPALSGTVDDLRSLLLGERDRVGTIYPPNAPGFYQSRANIDPAHLPGMLQQLVDEGTLGRDPVQGLIVRDLAATPTDLGTTLGQPWSRPADTLTGAQDAPQAAPADDRVAELTAIRDMYKDKIARLKATGAEAGGATLSTPLREAQQRLKGVSMQLSQARKAAQVTNAAQDDLQRDIPSGLSNSQGQVVDRAGVETPSTAQEVAMVAPGSPTPVDDSGLIPSYLVDEIAREKAKIISRATVPEGYNPDSGQGTVVNVLSAAAGKQPWQLTRDQWNSANGALRHETFGLNNSRSLAGESTALTNGKLWLRYGVPDLIDREFGNRGVSHRDVIVKALAEGQSVPPDVLKDYPDLQRGGVIARGKQAISDLFDEAPASTGNTPSALDQIKSSIKNPGLVGFPGGLPSPAVTRAMIGGGVGGLGGGATGLAGGLIAGDDPDQLKRDTATAALAGTAVGAGTGAGLPQLQGATQAALTAIAQHAPTLLDDTIASPEIQAIALRRGLANQAAAKGIKGAKLADLLPALDNLWRGQTTQTGKNLLTDAGTIRLLVNEFGDEFGATHDTVRATLGELAHNLDNPDPVAQAGTLGQTLRAIGQDKLLIPQNASDTTRGLHNLVGVDMVSNTTNKGTQLNAPQRIAAGAGIGLANAVTRISPLSPIMGAARAYVAPFADSYFGTLNGLQHDAPRVAFLQGALDRDLPQLATDFLGDLAAQGVGVKPLEALGGKFDGATLGAEIKRAGGGAQLASTAAKEWDTLTETLIRSRADRVAHLFGDFRDAAQTGMGGTAVKGIGRVFPFATWALKYAPVLAEIAAKHPRVTAGILGAELADAQQAKQDGRPAWQVGTIPLSTETPLIGGAVRARLGGQSGTMRLNPLSMISPYGGQQVSSLGDTSLDSAETPYEHAMNYANVIGLSPHPLLQAAAYVTGQDYKGPGSMSRTAGLEQLPQALPALLGHNALTDTLATTMPSAQNTLDAARKLISGQGSTATDPVARRYGELVLATTGKPLDNPANRAYLDPSNPAAAKLRDQATREAILSGAASNAYSLTSPLAATAQSTEAEAAAKVRGAVTQLQNSAAHQTPLEAASTQEAIRRYQDQHPGALVYDGATKQGLADLRLADWERQNAALRAIPTLYNYQKQIVMEQLGLVPPGTYANMVRNYALQQQMPGQFRPSYLPGVPMPTQQPMQWGQAGGSTGPAVLGR